MFGLALLGRRPGRWWDVLRRPSWHLNETGEAARDAVMIEYNGLLAERGREETARRLFLALLEKAAPSWRELHLGGVPTAWIAPCRDMGWATRHLRPLQGAPWADLTAWAATGPADDPLRRLSRNTRQQIRRSLRFYESRGPLTIRRAADIAEALEWLAALEDLHTATWTARGRPGAFANPRFRRFHQDFIGENFPRGIPDLLRIGAGDTVVGYLYNLRWRGSVSSYQSGLRYEDSPLCRPGLVSHVLAMALYRDEGALAYRFLAGNARYKESLSDRRDELAWMTAYRRGLPHRLEDGARTAWHWFGGLRRKAAGETQ